MDYLFNHLIKKAQTLQVVPPQSQDIQVKRNLHRKAFQRSLNVFSPKNSTLDGVGRPKSLNILVFKMDYLFNHSIKKAQTLQVVPPQPQDIQAKRNLHFQASTKTLQRFFFFYAPQKTQQCL